jgi:hypothetical protein
MAGRRCRDREKSHSLWLSFWYRVTAASWIIIFWNRLDRANGTTAWVNHGRLDSCLMGYIKGQVGTLWVSCCRCGCWIAWLLLSWRTFHFREVEHRICRETSHDEDLIEESPSVVPCCWRVLEPTKLCLVLLAASSQKTTGLEVGHSDDFDGGKRGYMCRLVARLSVWWVVLL